MGQKVNPNIFRLGVNKTWKTEFFEKKRHEFPIYTFKDLEIKRYIERFLESQGLLLHDYKHSYSNGTLNLFISYVIVSDFVFNKQDKSDKITFVTKSGKKKVLLSNHKDLKPKVLDATRFFKDSKVSNVYRTKKYLKFHSNRFKTSKTKQVVTINSESKHLNLKVKGVFENLFKVLSSFTNNKFDIIINFSCVNKTSSFLKKTQTKNFILIQKFKNTSFLKEGIELLFHVVHNRSSAALLTKFIVIQMKKVKRHKFFLSFLKQTLTVLYNSQFSTIKGIKIMIKGRLNGVPRAKHRTIIIGDVPVQTISAITDYSQMTVHNSSGSYGIKVWIIEK